MKLETYLDAYAKAYYEAEHDCLWVPLYVREIRMRQRDKFRQRVIDGVIEWDDNRLSRINRFYPGRGRLSWTGGYKKDEPSSD